MALTHGSKVNFSGKWFDIVSHGVDEQTELIDYDEVRDLAVEHRPKMIICGATAYPRLIDFAAFRQIADEVGAILMVDAAHFIGLVAGRAIPARSRMPTSSLHHAQGAAWPSRGGMIVCKEEHAKKIDKAVFPFSQGGPLMHAVAAKAVALREAQQPAFQVYARQVVANAQALADGLAAEGMRPVSGGTDTHLALIDLRPLGVTGAEAETGCDAARITLNKNAIPFDPQPPMTASGIRVGTPSVTTQGMAEGDMKEVASLISRAVRDTDGTAGREIGAAVSALVDQAPGVPARLAASARARIPAHPARRRRSHVPAGRPRRKDCLPGRCRAADPRPRRTPRPGPRLGGLAMLGGLLAAMLVASYLPAMSRNCSSNPRRTGAGGGGGRDLPGGRSRTTSGACRR